MDTIEIQNESNDHKYFTIIPNYILNHSSAIDQALYMQMKRIAGENGTCEAGYKYFIRQMGIGIKAYRKSLKYLIEHKWIEHLGKREVMTSGGKQLVNVYRVNDIWKLNVEHYKGGSKRTPLKDKGGARSKDKGVLKEHQRRTNLKEDNRADLNSEGYKKYQEAKKKLLVKGL